MGRTVFTKTALAFVCMVILVSCASTEIPGMTTPKVYNFSESELKQLDKSIGILMAPGTLPEGFDEFTLTVEEARNLVHCTPEEIQKAVKTIGDARLYMLVSGIAFNSHLGEGEETNDGRRMLLNNQCRSCGRWSSLYCYLLYDDFDEVGNVTIRSSVKDLTVPEKCYSSHVFTWCKKDGKYCFFDMQWMVDEIWERIRVVDDINDFVKQVPVFWKDKPIDLIYIYRATPQFYNWNNYNLGEYEIKLSRAAKGYIKVLYKNPKQNWHFTYNVDTTDGYIQRGGLEIEDEVTTSDRIVYRENTYYKGAYAGLSSVLFESRSLPYKVSFKITDDSVELNAKGTSRGTAEYASTGYDMQFDNAILKINSIQDDMIIADVVIDNFRYNKVYFYKQPAESN